MLNVFYSKTLRARNNFKADLESAGNILQELPFLVHVTFKKYGR